MSTALQFAETLYGQTVQGVSIEIGSTVLWTFDLDDPFYRTPKDLTASGVSVTMTVRPLDLRGNPDMAATPTISRAAIPSVSPINRCTVAWNVADTIPSGVAVPSGQYAVDVWWEDGSGNRVAYWKTSMLRLVPLVGSPGAPVTPLPGQTPLGQGTPGASIIWRGAYNPATAYNPLDEVSYAVGGVTSSYICILASTGNLPTNATYWNLSASGAAGGSGSGLPDQTGHANQWIKTDGTTAFWADITAADIVPSFAVASLTGAGGYAATKEVGDTIVNPSFTVGYTSGPATSATINDASGALALVSPFTAYTYAKTYTLTAVGQVITWTLAALKGAASANRTATATALGRVFYDMATPGTLNAAFIAALTGQALASGFARTIAYSAGGNTKKAYYAIPTVFGSPSTFKDSATGFAVPFSKVASAVAVTNSFGVVINYDIWASDNLLNSAFSLAVS